MIKTKACFKSRFGGKIHRTKSQLKLQFRGSSSASRAEFKVLMVCTLCDTWETKSREKELKCDPDFWLTKLHKVLTRICSNKYNNKLFFYLVVYVSVNKENHQILKDLNLKNCNYGTWRKTQFELTYVIYVFNAMADRQT